MEISRTLQETAGARVNELGRYRLIAELARGGMGIVYLALVRGPAGFNKLFVVKELKAHLAEDRELVSMFVEEARLAAKLSHPHVVQTIEVGSEGDRHFIAMEYLEGQSYHRMLHRAASTGNGVPLPYQLRILAAALDGLEYAHTLTDFDGAPLRIVHRDVSPQNIFVTYDGQVKVLDFGIAKALDSSNETRAGMLKGKVAYMAPEQAAGDPLDARADVFAAGVMVWEAAVGRRMWGSSLNDRQILHALVHGNVPPPRQLLPDIPEALERIILKATDAVPDKRHASAAELQAEIEAYLETVDVPAFGPRDVGRFVAEAFASERAQIKSVIDGQVKATKNLATGEYGAVALAQLSGPSGGGTPHSVSVVRGVSGATGENPIARPSLRGLDAAVAASSAPAASGAHVAAAPKRSFGLIAALMAAVVALAGVLVFVLTRPSTPPAAAPVAQPTAPPATTTAAAPLPTQGVEVARPAAAPTATTPPAVEVSIKLKVSPSQARLWVDGVEVASNPYSARLPKGLTSHKLRAEARGFATREMEFTADSDVSLEVALEPVHAGMAFAHAPAPVKETHVEPAVAPPPQPAAPAPQAAPQPERTGRPVRPIDSKNPY